MTTSALIDRNSKVFSDAVKALFWAREALHDGDFEGWALQMRSFRIRCVLLSEIGDKQDTQRVMDVIVESVL